MNHQTRTLDFRATDGSTRTVEGVTLYDENSLNMSDLPSASVCVTELGAKLLACRDGHQMRALMATELSNVGFDWLEYGEMAWSQSGFQSLSCLVSHLPRGWAQTYCQQHLWSVDTRLSARLTTGVPAIWSVQQQMVRERAREQPRQEALHFSRQLLAAGVCSGMTLVLPASAPGRATVIHWLSRQVDLSSIEKCRLSAALVMGLAVHECLSHLRQPSRVPQTLVGGLTPQQSCIAECLSKGMSDKSIARALSLSTHAVDYHLRALRSKFNVHNRVQLAKALEAVAMQSV